MSRPLTFAIGLGLLSILCFSLTGCWRPPTEPPAMGPPTVSVSYPLQRDVTDYEQFTGRTVAIDSVQIRARDKARASLNAARANVEQAQLNLSWTKVVDPIDGRIGRTLVTRGNLVMADQTLLTTIVSMDPMYAYFDVDEQTMLRVQELIRE